jgi:hypothetical protein
MSSKLKSWFFSTIRNTNSRGKYINFADGSEPDQVTFSNLLDTTVLKKADGDYQDQADFNAVNSESNTKFTTADNLPIIENSDNGAITLDVTPADTNSEKIKYKINPKFVTDIEEIGPNNRADDVFVAPSNLPRVVAGTTGTPVSGQAPLFQGAGFVSSFVNYYETFTITFNTLTTAFMSHSGVLLSTVLNTLRADVDAKVSDAELASEVSDLTILINNKATKVTPTVATGGNGTKVTVNSQGIVTNIDKAKASDLKNDSSVSGSTIKDALNNLNSTLAGEIVATICPLSSNETVDFTGVKGTKHLVDTTAGDVVATLPEDITSNSGDLCMISKESSDSYTITVENESTDILIVLKNENDNALFHFNDGKWGYIGVIPDPSTITRFTASAVDGITMSFNTSYICNLSANVAMTLPAITPTDYYNVITIEHYHPNNYTATITGVHDISATPTSFTDVLKTGDSVCYIAVSGIGWLHLSKDISTITQTVTNGVTDKSPSEDAVYDAIENSKGLVKDIVFKTIADSVLEVDKLNWVTLSSNHSMTIPSATISNLGKILIVNNRSSYELTIDLVTTTDVVLKGADSVLGIVCVTNGPAYNWEVFSRYNKGDFDSLVQDAINDGVTTISPSQNAVFDALALKLDLDGGNANQDIDIGNYSLNAKHVKINGTAGAGHLGLKHQSANITASASESSIGANSVGNPVWKNDGNAIDELELISRKTNTVTGNETSTTKYLSVKGIYDWAVGLFAPIASPTFTGTVTTPDVIVSGATASTIAHFDATKNIESLPLATYPSLTELSYVKGVTSALQTQINTKLGGSGLTTDYLPKYNGTNLVNSLFRESGTTGGFNANNVGVGFSIKNPSVGNSNVLAIYSSSNAVLAGWYETGNQFQLNGNSSIDVGVGGSSSSVNINAPTATYGALNIRAKTSYAIVLYTNGGTYVHSIDNNGNMFHGVQSSASLNVCAGGGELSSTSSIFSTFGTTKGSLPAPRMTNAQRTAISSPAIGLMVYCTDATEGLYIYKSTGWTFII